MKIASLFSGIGGLDLGLKQAGHEIILQCESDPAAQQVLRKKFPGVLLVPDICSLISLPKGVEAVAAGFPCIDVSKAGLRRGLDGQSTGLIRHVFRLLEDALHNNYGIPWVLLENVESLLDRFDGSEPVVKYIVEAFECLGYHSWAQRVVCSAAFGVPNRRKRVFILASLHGDARDALLAQGCQDCQGTCTMEKVDTSDSGPCYQCYHPDTEDFRNSTFAMDLGNARSAPGIDLCPTFTTHNNRICLLLPSQEMGLLRIEDAERLQGFPEGWTEGCYPVNPPGIFHHQLKQTKETDSDKRDALRFALIGNAVTVQVAKWLGERLMQPYKYKYVPTGLDTILNLHIDSNSKKTPKLLTKQRKSQCLQISFPSTLEPYRAPDYAVDLQFEEPYSIYQSNCSSGWPRCAWYLQGYGRYAAQHISDAPMKLPLQPLGDFIEQVGKPASEEALTTYLQRLKEHGWDVYNTIQKAISCGSNLKKEVCNVSRLTGLTQDADSIGDVVWAKISQHNNVWWPAEMLDPKNMPPCGVISRKALQSLQMSQKRQVIQTLKKNTKVWETQLKIFEEIDAKEELLGNIGNIGQQQQYNNTNKEINKYLMLKQLNDECDNIMEIKQVINEVIDNVYTTYINNVENASSQDSCTINGINQANWTQINVSQSKNISTNNSEAKEIQFMEVDNHSVFDIIEDFSQDNDKVDVNILINKCSKFDDGTNDCSFLQCYEGDREDNTNNNIDFGLNNNNSDINVITNTSNIDNYNKSNYSKNNVEFDFNYNDKNTCDDHKKFDKFDMSSNSLDNNTFNNNQMVVPSNTIENNTTINTLVLGDMDMDDIPVFIQYYSAHRDKWCYKTQTLPFAECKEEMLQNARTQIRLGNLKYRAKFFQAVEIAQKQLTIKQGREKQNATYQEALSWLASSKAVAANRQPRCGKCEVCIQHCGGNLPRRCLVRRAQAAAGAGHAGAQLGVLGTESLGAKVKVWWPLDEAWYQGMILEYDPLRVRHTIKYDDGDVEIIPLWAPHQLIRLLNKPEEWQQQLAKYKHKIEQDKKHAEEKQQMNKLQKIEENENELERTRKMNIKRNSELLQALLSDDLIDFKPQRKTRNQSKKIITKGIRKRKRETVVFDYDDSTYKNGYTLRRRNGKISK